MISGWERGLVGMKVGGKRTLKIPPQQDYGYQCAGAAILPGAHLMFDCELKSIANFPAEEKLAEMKSSINPFNHLAFSFIIGNVVYFVIPTN